MDDIFFNTIYHDFSVLDGCRLVPMKLSYECPNTVKKINSWRLPLPWLRGSLAGKLFYDSIFDEAIPIKEHHNCYIIYGRILDNYGPALFSYLKNRDKDGVFICYLGDVAESFRFKIRDITRKFDYVYTLDHREAEKYNIGFLQEPYSFRTIPEGEQIYDVLFVGTAKNRIEKIYTVYEKLKENGFRCKFYISGVSDEKMKYEEEIIYNEYLDYEKILDLLSKSRCVLEILQEKANTTTTRYSEALIYKKYLLTDSEYLRRMKELPPNILLIDYSDWSCLEKIRVDQDFDNSVAKKELSIKNMIDVISKDIINHNLRRMKK